MRVFPAAWERGSLITWKINKIDSEVHVVFQLITASQTDRPMAARGLRRIQSYGTSLKLKNDLLDFNEIQYQQFSFIGVDYVLHLISLSNFNLPLIGTFTWPTPPRPYRATTCRGRGLNYGSYTYFFDHTRTWRASPDEWSVQCRGHLRDSTNMNDNTHQAHTQSSQQGEYGMIMMTTAKWYSGTSGD